MGILLFIIFVVVGLAIFSGISQAQALAKAKEAYQASLRELTRNPTNPTTHQRTLDLGRAYSRLTRNNKGVTLFDEMALMNDINAACGGNIGIARADPQSMRALGGSSSTEERLQRLTQLKNQGLINDNEYQTKRQQILNDM